jgi:hypothetical protein
VTSAGYWLGAGIGILLAIPIAIALSLNVYLSMGDGALLALTGALIGDHYWRSHIG